VALEVLELVADPARRIVVRMKVKFCGVTNLADAQEAVRLGAWAIGLNHHSESPRFVGAEAAAESAAELRRRIELVGVFVDPTLDELARAAENEFLSMVQLHGNEGPAFCREAARRTGCKVIKALRVRSTADIRRAEAYRTDFHLFDSHRPDRAGGTGESFDWDLLAARRSQVPLILAGGLNPDNVVQAARAARPFAVDVASGVEASPGVKDHALMAAFFERAQPAIRESDAELAAGVNDEPGR
jgi:phosphoribosylanthranilate isomerase